MRYTRSVIAIALTIGVTNGATIGANIGVSIHWAYLIRKVSLIKKS
jgi:hypothetical protein